MSGDRIFDFGNLTNFMDTLTQAANQKAVAAKEVAGVAATEKSRIADSAAAYQNEAEKSLTRLQTINAKGEEARRMADSGNIIDRVTLIGEQILDPRNFTAKGREQQIGEMSQSLAMQGQIHNVEVTAAAARIDEAVAQADVATAGVDAKVNVLRAQVDGLNLMNQAIAQTESLRQQNLIQADLPTVQKALMGPIDPSHNGKISIGGMLYAPAELQEREKALTTRDQLAMLSPQATDPDFAQKLRVHQDLILANYSLPELEILRQNNYTMPDGTQVQPAVWDSHYSRQVQLQQDTLQQQMNAATLDNQVPQMLKESQQMATNLQQYAAPGTPLAVARNNFLAAANNVATLAAKDTTPNGKLLQVTALQKAQKEMMDAVDKEAKFKAAGDSQLAGIYRNQMLGMPIQPSQVEDVVRSRYVANKGFGELLPNDVANRMRRNADQQYAKLKQQAAASLDPLAPTKTEKQLREEAVNQALDMERDNAGVDGINMILMQAIPQRKDNPAIKAGLVPGQLQELQQRAHVMAVDSIQKRENLTDAEMLAIKNNNPENAGITKERASMIGQQINIESVMTEYDLLEKQKPGLGYEMQQWYMHALPEMAKNFTANLDPMQQVITGDSVLNQAQNLAGMYTLADESATARGRQVVTEMATGARKPENMWPVLLQSNKKLADSQRSTIFYDVIQPAIKEARARGANDEVTSQSVMDALSSYRSDDPTQMSAIKTMLRDLPNNIDDFQMTWAYIMAQNHQQELNRRPMIKPEEASKQIQSVLPWMNK